MLTTAYIAFCCNLEGLILPKIEMNRCNGECEEADFRLFREHSPEGRSLLCMLLPQTHHMEIAAGFGLDCRAITTLHFRIVSHPFSHSLQGDYQTQEA